MCPSHARLLMLTLLLAACGEGLSPSATGSIQITTVTQGEPTDPDGYRVAVDERQEPLGDNATLTITGVTFGEHRLELLGVASNCAVTGENPRTVTVEEDPPLRLTLQISCGAGRGSLTVYTKTAGPDVDLDGYSVRLDGGAEQPIDLNRLVTYPSIPAGDHTLLLSSVAANCTVDAPNPRGAVVTAGWETSITFRVACHSTDPGTILFTSDRSGEQHVYRIEPNGSGLTDLTPDAQGAAPDWSPDHRQIVFSSTRDGASGVYLLTLGGGAPTRLADGSSPVWSPDGRRIAYTGPDGVTVMNADGSGPVVLATGHSPAWSPDGGKIAFNRTGACAELCNVALWIMNADGSGARNLTPASYGPDQWLSPSWSPDGARIAFVHSCCFLFTRQSSVATVETSGGTPSEVYYGNVVGRPVWSPTGSTLAFAVAQQDGTTELMLMPSYGAAPDVVASSPASEYPASWR